MKLLWPIALQAMAFGVAFAEVIVPSFGILLVLCLGLAGFSWYVILTQLPHSAALWFGLADLITVPLFIRFAFGYLGRSAISHRTDLGRGSGLDAMDKDLQRHVGVTAVVDATLRPTGRIRIGDDTFEAQTGGDWVEKGAQVKVVSVNGSRFHVEKP
ncbi:MAG TPA: NfeD family protein [Fibrobacteria bacterium]|nr:NfeD family protein [Fibrobacteria bacterium]